MARPWTCPQCGQIVTVSAAQQDGVCCRSCGHKLEWSGGSLAELPEALPVDEDVLDAILVNDQAVHSNPTTSAGQRRLPLAYWSAQLRHGLAIQYGFIVLRPHYVAFVPTSGSSNIAHELATNAIGVTTIDLEGLFKYRSYSTLRGMLGHAGIGRFDALVSTEVARSRGVFWRLNDVCVSREPNPILSSWDLLVFTRGETSIHGIPPKKDREFIQKTIQDEIGEAPLPVRHPYKIWTLVAVMPTLAAIGVYTSVGHKNGHDIVGLICTSFTALIAAVAWTFTIKTYYRALRKK